MGELLGLVQNAARYVACVGVPLVLGVSDAIGVEPGAQEARILVREYDLAAHGVVVDVLKADGGLEATKPVHGLDDVDVVVQVDAAVLHEQENAPVVAAVAHGVDGRAALLVEDGASHRYRIQVDHALELGYAHDLVPVDAGERAVLAVNHDHVRILVEEYRVDADHLVEAQLGLVHVDEVDDVGHDVGLPRREVLVVEAVEVEYLLGVGHHVLARLLGAPRRVELEQRHHAHDGQYAELHVAVELAMHHILDEVL